VTQVVLADTVRLQQSGSDAPIPAPVPVDSTPTASAPPPARVPEREPPPGEIVPGDSLEIIQRQILELRERRRRDSVAAEKQAREAQRVRDSLVAAQETETAEQRVRDSLTMVARRAEEAAAARAQASPRAGARAAAEGAPRASPPSGARGRARSWWRRARRGHGPANSVVSNERGQSGRRRPGPRSLPPVGKNEPAEQRLVTSNHRAVGRGHGE
jgi:hypothetical protein